MKLNCKSILFASIVCAFLAGALIWDFLSKNLLNNEQASVVIDDYYCYLWKASDHVVVDFHDADASEENASGEMGTYSVTGVVIDAENFEKLQSMALSTHQVVDDTSITQALPRDCVITFFDGEFTLGIIIVDERRIHFPGDSRQRISYERPLGLYSEIYSLVLQWEKCHGRDGSAEEK